MTWRSVLLGLVCSIALCCFTYFNQSVMRQSAVVGNYIPLSVYGTLILIVVLVNPLLRRLRGAASRILQHRFTRPWAFSGPELAVTITMVLCTCGIAESGFLKTFTNVAMLPRHYRRTTPAWDYEDTGTFKRLPEHFIAETGEDDEALNGYLQGRVGNERISLGDVPWEQWRRPLMTWVPVVLLLLVGFTALSLVVHRQWREHEKLPYPLATFAAELLGKGGDAGKGSVLHQRAFWVAAGVILGIHLVNFAHSWWPEYVIRINTSFDLQPLMHVIPAMDKARLRGALLYCRTYFAVVGVAYIVSSDVSFSFTVVPFLGTIVQGILATYGVSFMGGSEHRATIYTSLNIGSFVAFLFMIVFFGRHHYWNVLRRAFGMKTRDSAFSYEVWGCRVFLFCTIAATGMMIGYGLAWPFAFCFMFMIICFYVCVSRVVAQTGLFIMKPAWVPHILLLGLFGGYALGPTAALIAMFFSSVLFAEARETVMPYMVNSFCLLEQEGEGPKLGKIATWSIAAATAGLIIGLTVMLCLQYKHGTDMAAGGWFTNTVPTYPFELSTDLAQRLKSQGALETSTALTSWQRVLATRSERTFVVSFLIGVALVVGCYMARIRIKNWPINPAVFLLWSWSHCAKLTFSFFLGWCIKSAVSRYGGWQMVQKVKVVMIGVIAGDMLGAFIPAVISAVYWMMTGDPPRSYNIMP